MDLLCIEMPKSCVLFDQKSIRLWISNINIQSICSRNLDGFQNRCEMTLKQSMIAIEWARTVLVMWRILRYFLKLGLWAMRLNHILVLQSIFEFWKEGKRLTIVENSVRQNWSLRNFLYRASVKRHWYNCACSTSLYHEWIARLYRPESAQKCEGSV